MKLSAIARSTVRRTIAKHPAWPETRVSMGLGTLDSLRANDYPAICEALGIDIVAIARAADGEETPQTPDVETPEKEPAPVPKQAPHNPDIAAQVANALAPILAGMQTPAPAIDEAQIVELIKKHGAKPATVKIDLTTPEGVKIDHDETLMHHAFPALMAAVNAGVNVMLVGPAGSGKTTAAEKAAELLETPFYFTGALDTKYGLTGFIDAQGRVIETPFVKAYRDGGLFLFDEIDGSVAGAILSFNAALANGHADLPSGMVPRHKEFRCIAAANTFGRGADRQYVGRQQLDAASLDRFVILDWDYDTGLEAAMIGAPRPDDAPSPVTVKPVTDPAIAQQKAAQWFDHVRRMRNGVSKAKIRHVVSPRATVHGAKLLAAGWSWDMVEQGALWKGLDADSIQKVKAAA